MPDPRSLPDDRPNVGTDPLETDIAELQGESLPADQDAVLESDQVETGRECDAQRAGVGHGSDAGPRAPRRGRAR